MNNRLMLCVQLWLRHDDTDAFETFERKAAQAMALYGGRIERAIRVTSQPGRSDAPFEIHLVSFPNAASFAAYRNGPETKALAAERNAIIERTEVLEGRETWGYGIF